MKTRSFDVKIVRFREKCKKGGYHVSNFRINLYQRSYPIPIHQVFYNKREKPAEVPGFSFFEGFWINSESSWNECARFFDFVGKHRLNGSYPGVNVAHARADIALK